MVRGRKNDWEPEIKPLTAKDRREAAKASNAVPSNLKPVRKGGVTKWVKK
jgi:hypothetical protein